MQNISLLVMYNSNPASVFKIVKAYNVKEIIDVIQSYNDITTLLILFIFTQSYIIGCFLSVDH